MTPSLRRLLAAFVVVPAVLACASDHMDDENASALGIDIQGARSEVARHQDAVANADALDELPAEVARHEHQMDAVMDGMEARMGGMMSHCSGSGMGRMHTMMDSMDDEMQSHRVRMSAATALEQARTYSESHAAAMDDMLDDMHAALGDVGCMMR